MYLQLAFARQAHLNMLQRRPDAASRRGARLTAGDDRRALTRAIALDNVDAQSLPDSLRLDRQRRAAGRQQAQRAAELAMDHEKQTPPHAHWRAVGQRDEVAVQRGWQPRLEALFEGVAHQHQQLRHGHHVGDPLLVQHAHDVWAAATGDVVHRRATQHRIQQTARQLEQE